MSRPLRLAPVAVPLALAFAAAASTQEAAPPRQAFGEVVRATAVTVTISAVDAAGGVPADLAAADFQVFEDGVEVPVIGLERFTVRGGGAVEAPAPPAPPAPPAASPTAAADASAGFGTPPGAGAEPWQIVVYFDAPTASIPTVQGAARELAAHAEELAALGSVELVVAAPAPERRHAATRDPEALGAAFTKLAEKGVGTNEIAQLRREFVAASDADNADELSRSRGEAANTRPRGGGAGQPPGSILYRNEGARGGDSRLPSGASAMQRQMLIRTSAQREAQLLARQRTLLLDWLALTERPRRARALILVSDGFDLDPSEFYASYLRDATQAASLTQELRGMGSGAPFEQLARTVAAAGWQVLPVSLSQPGAQSANAAEVSGRSRYRGFTRGARSEAPGSGLSSFLLRAPLDPLRTLAEVTGGELALSAGQLATAVEALGDRLRLTYQVARAPDGELHRLEVRSRRPGLEVRAPRSVSAAAPDALMAARARRVLGTDEAAGSELEVHLTATAAKDPEHADAVMLEIAYEAELDVLRAQRPRVDAAQLRVTVAVELPDGRVLISQDRPAARDLSGERRFAAREPLRVPKGTKRVAVVVDDVDSGAWGGDATVPRG